MIKSFFIGLLFLCSILLTSSAGYSQWKNYDLSIPQSNIEQIMNDKFGKDQIDCIIEATYFEARGEEEIGHKAIVEVIVNRTLNSRFPNNFCDVVKQNMQFSYRNGDKKYNLFYGNKEVKQAITNTVYQHLYSIERSSKNRVIPVCSTHYDGKSFKKPKWSYSMDMVKEIGNHQFYCYQEA